MLDDIRAGHVKNVLVFKLDRLTRSVADLVYLMDVFSQNGCAFNSLMESIDTGTASGRMFLKIIGIFAEFERENIAERVRTGKERKSKEGFTNSSTHASYGFDRPNGERIQTINAAEAENVRMIFDMYVNQGMSLSAISRSLNMQKIPSKKGGYLWNAATIRAVLTNCNTIGNVRYCTDDPYRSFEAEGKHEAIILKANATPQKCKRCMTLPRREIVFPFKNCTHHNSSFCPSIAQIIVLTIPILSISNDLHITEISYIIWSLGDNSLLVFKGNKSDNSTSKKLQISIRVSKRGFL